MTCTTLPVVKALFITEDQRLTFFSLTLQGEDVRNKITEAVGAAFRTGPRVIAPANIISLGDSVFVQLASPLIEYQAVKRLVGQLAHQHQLALSTATYSIDEVG